MSKKILDLSNIPISISSNYFRNQTGKIDNLPSFMDSYGYIDKFCKNELLKNKDFLNGISDVIKGSLKLDVYGKSFILPDDNEFFAEAEKIGLDIVMKKNAEVLKILQISTDIYNKNSKRFLNDIVINHLHHSNARYEVLNLYFSLLSEFSTKEDKKALEYVYVTCDMDMMRVLENKTLKFEDFCYMFICTDISLYNNIIIEAADLSTLPERYKKIRIYG